MKAVFFGVSITALWVVVSPWVLGFSDLIPALWSNVAAGLLIFILSLWAVFGVDKD